ncbi:MAG TPA: cardiolipin synthase [Firmicutes bacterium]|nr:cardiolipin synthase [Bacillota bacterium]
MIVIITILLYLSTYYGYFQIFFTLISTAIGIYIINKNENPIYKIAWLIPIILSPILGGCLYLLFGKRHTRSHVGGKILEIQKSTQNMLPENAHYLKELQELNPLAAKHSQFIYRDTFRPVWKNTQTEFLSPGERFYEVLMEELQKAEHFIFMEYFILDEGKMRDTIMDLLIQKAAQGVEVRFLYDDMGTIQLLPRDYDQKLREQGLNVRVFNPFKPSLDSFWNNRDHRKITVIDGHVGFTGGINLADEYINEIERFGYWQDSSIMLKGDAVQNLTLMFLEMWNFAGPETSVNDFNRYLPTCSYPSDGYVQPFDDNPIDDCLPGELTYINIINSATRYVYITTPYLVLDHEMETALCLCARSGVDVRIITPHIEDKWYVHVVTRSYYRDLLQGGVKIYEFKPGFIHSKTVVSDDSYAVVGTTNFDFRSFYLHFECGVWMYQSKAVPQVKEEFLRILESCIPVTEEFLKKIPLYKRMLAVILRIFAPLL